MSDLWYADYVPGERSDELKRHYIMPSIGATASDDAAVDVDSIADWTSLQDAWGVASFESRSTGAPRAVSEIEAYTAPGLWAEYTPSQPGSYGRGAGSYGAGSYGAGSYATTSAPSATTGYYATSAPSYYASGAPSGTSAAYEAPAYSLGDLYNENRVSCSGCNWVLEDKSWCCDRNCNDPNGGHYRQSYVCAYPSDPTGKLTSRCEVDTECLADQPPTMCSAERLLERQREDTRDDPACATWRSRTSRPVGTQAWSAPTQWGTSAPTQWGTSAPTQWRTSAPTQSYSPTAPWLGNA